MKYNDLLREFGANLEGCKGNKYVTTTHVINSAIVKLSKLTIATKVYRGVGGGVLPESFWRPNKQGVKGGIEMAFMSTTFERGVAMEYVKSDRGKPALVFEMQMGMVDRGAELGWVSQYPHEKGERHTVLSTLIQTAYPPLPAFFLLLAECVFAPLTGIEVLGTRVESAVLVIEARLSINLNALTIEQVDS